MADCIEESVLAKVGQELFKEMLRLYSCAEPHDYFKQGKWNDLAMRQDLQLYWFHRSEAGSPDPTALEKVVMPDLPVEKPSAAVAFAGAAVLSRPGVAGAATNGGSTPSNLSTLRETMAKLAAAKQAGALTPKTASSSSSISLQSPAAIAGGKNVAVSDLKEIALFVAKFKFEPAKVKAVLGKLDGNKRRYVIQKFSSDASSGKAVTTALEDYVAELEVSDDWDGFTGEAVAASPAKAPVKNILSNPKAGASLLGTNLLGKRPAPASAEESATKVARVGGLGVTTAAAVAARLAAARTASALTANAAAKKAGASPAWAQPAKATVAIRPGAAKWAGGAGKA